MLDTLVTSKTRLKLILKFFLNPCSSAYLRELAEEFGESSNAVRLELNRKIRYLILSPSEVGAHLGDEKGSMLIWRKE